MSAASCGRWRVWGCRADGKVLKVFGVSGGELPVERRFKRFGQGNDAVPAAFAFLVRKERALSAWFWVAGATLRSRARSLR
jgi:hypothetical protein